MKILFIANYPPPYGGIPGDVKIICDDLQKKYEDTQIVVSYSLFQNPLKKVDKQSPDRIIYRLDFFDSLFGLIRHPIRFIKIAKYFFGENIFKLIFHAGINNKIYNIISKSEIDIIDSYHIFYPSMHGYLISKDFKKKYIVNIYGEIYRNPEFFSKFSKKIKLVLENSYKVISCSNHCMESLKLIDLSIKNKQVILPSIDVELFKKLDKEKNKFKDLPFVQDRKKIIGYLGRFEKEMGLLIFLDLINKPELKNNKFLIIGASGALSGYTKSIEGKNKDRVIVYSDVREKKLPHLLNLCDVLIVPSINERACYGKAIAEGQSCGVPVIASNLGGHKEVIENNHSGMFFEPNNSDDLKNKINYLIDDSELRNEIINNGLKKSPQYSNHIKLKYNFEVYKGALKR